MPIEVKSDDENLIFEDYQKRKVIIKHSDYLSLMMSEERMAIRPVLEDCLMDPTEVWWKVEKIEGIDYSFYKYFKLFSNLVFIAVVMVDAGADFELNNFYSFNDNEFDEADKERNGQLILSKLR